MTIQEDLSRYFLNKGIDSAQLAAKYDLYMSPDQIHFDYDGLTFDNHTWTHPLMTLLLESLSCKKYGGIMFGSKGLGLSLRCLRYHLHHLTTIL